MEITNPLPPPGSKPGRYIYTRNNAGPVWVEYSRWQLFPWFKVLGLVIAFLAVLIAGLGLWETLGRPWPK